MKAFLTTIGLLMSAAAACAQAPAPAPPEPSALFQASRQLGGSLRLVSATLRLQQVLGQLSEDQRRTQLAGVAAAWLERDPGEGEVARWRSQFEMAAKGLFDMLHAAALRMPDTRRALMVLEDARARLGYQFAAGGDLSGPLTSAITILDWGQTGAQYGSAFRGLEQEVETLLLAQAARLPLPNPQRPAVVAGSVQTPVATAVVTTQHASAGAGSPAVTTVTTVAPVGSAGVVGPGSSSAPLLTPGSDSTLRSAAPIPMTAAGGSGQPNATSSPMIPSTNLALGKPTRTSSRSQWSTPTEGGAVDGVRTGRFGFHTSLEPNPWWEVDLQQTIALSEIRIYNTHYSERARTLQAWVSADGTSWRQVYSHNGTTFGASGAPLSIPGYGAAARFVRLGLSESNYFHLDEVEVYASGSGPVGVPPVAVAPAIPLASLAGDWIGHFPARPAEKYPERIEFTGGRLLVHAAARPGDPASAVTGVARLSGPGEIEVPELNKRGRILDNGNRIEWSNSAVWVRGKLETPPVSLTPAFIGCYRDDSTRDIDGFTFSDAKMTAAACSAACAARGFSIAATQFGSHCFCGNTYGKYGPSDSCVMPCSGNPGEICGGGWANSVYRIGAASATALSSLAGDWIGHFPARPAEKYPERIEFTGGRLLVHAATRPGDPASAVTGVARLTGASEIEVPELNKRGRILDNGNRIEWSNSAVWVRGKLETPPVSLTPGFIGCYRDDWTRDIGGFTFSDANMTARACIAACAARGFAIAATQFSSHCFCGNTYGKYGIADNCNMACSGNAAEVCGGSFANSVFRVVQERR